MAIIERERTKSIMASTSLFVHDVIASSKGVNLDERQKVLNRNLTLLIHRSRRDWQAKRTSRDSQSTPNMAVRRMFRRNKNWHLAHHGICAAHDPTHERMFCQ